MKQIMLSVRIWWRSVWVIMAASFFPILCSGLRLSHYLVYLLALGIASIPALVLFFFSLPLLRRFRCDKISILFLASLLAVLSSITGPLLFMLVVSAREILILIREPEALVATGIVTAAVVLSVLTRHRSVYDFAWSGQSFQKQPNQ